jgi:hypothetical protein
LTLEEVHETLIASSYLEFDLLSDRCNGYIAYYIKSLPDSTLEEYGVGEISNEEMMSLAQEFDGLINKV